MKYLLVIIILLLFGCASHTRIVVCPGKKADANCIKSFLPQGSKILSVKPTDDKDFYEVEYR